MSNGKSPDDLKPVELSVGPVSGKHEDVQMSLSAERRQNIDLRNYGFLLAIAIIVLTVAMEIVILNCILMEGATNIHVAVVVAPIASFTTITIAVLIGVFRGFLSKDTDRVTLGGLTSTITGA